MTNIISLHKEISGMSHFQFYISLSPPQTCSVLMAPRAMALIKAGEYLII